MRLAKPGGLATPVVAHEIGHMYLGKNKEAHSKTGVWQRRQLELLSIGELSFTREQGAHPCGDRSRPGVPKARKLLPLARALRLADFGRTASPRL